ncbi:uncharacterized protein LOC128822302 [Vidua macroura]|uniref:uncharacterized protein LOC128822302 n=1 Tax=Vidua macroura TaxID=187451 RepID=UPI0023A8F1B6|nr:uncharacterized protein LOC128822302 [Vidua macroura]
MAIPAVPWHGTPAVPSERQSPPNPREPAGRQRPRSELAAFAAGDYLVQDYVSQRLLPGLHMLDAAPGSSWRGAQCGGRAAGAAAGAAPGATGGAALPGADPGADTGPGPGGSLCSSRRSFLSTSRCRPRRGILPVRPRERTAEPRRWPGPERSRAAPPRAGSMPRGRAWTQAEVSSLLSLVGGSGEAALLMASTSRPNEALWREISRGLAAAGYGRSVAQCRSKWKALKQAFHSERETRRRAGHHSPRLPPHYRAMKSIWKAAGRPVFGERRMPDVVKLPSRGRKSALATRSPSSPEPPEHDVGGDTPSTLLSPVLQCAKDKPESHKYMLPAPEHPTHMCILHTPHCSHSWGFGTEVMQDTSQSLVCLGSPAIFPHWVTTFCLPKFPLQFQVDVGFFFSSSPSLLCSVAARCSAAAAFQPRGGCIAVVAAGGEHIAGVPPTPPAMPHTGCCFSPLSLLGCHTDLKQEGAEGKASFPGETSLRMGRGNRVLPLTAAAIGSHRTAAMSEQPAAGSGMAGLLQNVQQLLVQILQTSRQQQALLESLASDTVSHLHLLSHSLVQVGETLHQLLLWPHPGPIGHYVPHVPLFEGGSGVPCSPGAPHTSPDHKEEPQLSPDARCIPP